MIESIQIYKDLVEQRVPSTDAAIVSRACAVEHVAREISRLGNGDSEVRGAMDVLSEAVEKGLDRLAVAATSESS